VQAIVAEAIHAMQADGSKLDGGRLAYPEPEAAAAIGVASHVLRDARLRNEITGTKLGGRWGYERSELLAYLARNREAAR
jgi:hypothetical protein